MDFPHIPQYCFIPQVELMIIAWITPSNSGTVFFFAPERTKSIKSLQDYNHITYLHELKKRSIDRVFSGPTGSNAHIHL